MGKIAGSGSGISRKTRLDLPSVIGDDGDPFTVGNARELVRLLKLWADRLPFGRIGFQVATYTDTSVGGVVTDLPITFAELVEDSHRFAKTDITPDLTYFQIPPGMGRAYALSYNVDAAVAQLHTDTFNHTGAVQTFTVPADVTEILVTCRGAQGGTAAAFGTGGKGAEVVGTINVTPGQIYDLYVGFKSINNVGGFPDAGNGDNDAGNDGRGGGGSTSIRLQADTFANSYIVAGGGGGAGSGGGGIGVPNADGGYGAWNAAQAGQGYFDPDAGGPAQGAQGATQVAGGQGGYDTGLGGGPWTITGAPGTFGAGGAAADTTNAFAHAGGGGGGGWYGGGGGGKALAATYQAGGGGGGSSWVRTGVSGVTHTDNSRSGNGQMVITYTTYTPAADTDINVKLWVAYKTWRDEQPYAHVVMISADSGLSPLKGCIFHPLNELDRIWMTVTNLEVDLTYRNLVLSVYADGQ